jgi:hypothetical protein
MIRRIITHRAPDLDAVVAAWLAQTYLFEGMAEVCFLSRRLAVDRHTDACLVDVGNAYDPARLRFDHKPPAFADRNETCAAKLVWQHLMALGKRVGHLEPLVRVTFEGDTRRHSRALRQSRVDGPHAALGSARRLHPLDEACYAAMRRWLDEYDRAIRPSRAECRLMLMIPCLHGGDLQVS